MTLANVMNMSGNAKQLISNRLLQHFGKSLWQFVRLGEEKATRNTERRATSLRLYVDLNLLDKSWMRTFRRVVGISKLSGT